MAVVYRGTPISQGVALGHVLTVKELFLNIPQQPPDDRVAEVGRFCDCHRAAVEETQSLLENAKICLGKDEANILDAQLTFIQDEFSVIEPIKEAIVEEGLNMAQAIDCVLSKISNLFRQADDEYMRQRAADAEDIRRRLLTHSLDLTEQNYSDLPPDTILAARNLTPSDTIRMDLAHVSAIITEQGGYYSHVGIITRNQGIPSVSGLNGILTQLQDGDEVIVNGNDGTVIAQVGTVERNEFYDLLRHQREEAKALERYRFADSCAADGTQGLICANIGNETEVSRVLEAGAEGIGLLRSEFLYMNCGQLPSEEVQFQAYRKVLEAMGNRPVTIRTLDIGGDKDLPSLPMEHEDNPFLGCRAIRLCLSHVELFRTQLRALLRASVYGNLHIMFPMISSLDELHRAKAILDRAREELTVEGITTAPVRTGMMVEVPSSALLADTFAKEVDFFSIGTNDLIQYTVAAERGNPGVEYLYTPYHPAVLRLIAMTANAARENGILCGMCGEAAADTALLPLLWGMGLREFSMSPGAVTTVRSALAGIETAACEALVPKILSCSQAKDVKELLQKQMYSHLVG